MTNDTKSTEESVYSFKFQQRYLPMLATLGITPFSTRIRITGDQLSVKFGLWRAETALSNIKDVCVTGPYKAYRAIGARASFSDSGATFGTTTAGGACVRFRRPVPALDPTKRIRHEALTLTVEDPEGFADALRKAAGLRED